MLRSESDLVKNYVMSYHYEEDESFEGMYGQGYRLKIKNHFDQWLNYSSEYDISYDDMCQQVWMSICRVNYGPDYLVYNLIRGVFSLQEDVPKETTGRPQSSFQWCSSDKANNRQIDFGTLIVKTTYKLHINHILSLI